LPRFLDALISTPNAHWLHHARNVAAGTSNYSSFTLLFDHLFGTFRRQPAGRIEDVGIAFDPIPRNVVGQVFSPVAWPWLTHRARRSAASNKSLGGTHA
jgi:sterol desaturase/sphingolipid hydroxylase (fatty acid hydroxylase superfamily)